MPDDEDFSVVYSDGGLIAADDVRRLIRDHYGIRIVSVVFRARDAAPGNTVWFDAVTDLGEPWTGRLVLHARVGQTHVLSWGEVLIDERLHRRNASQRNEGLEATLEEIAAMGRDLVQTIMERPTFSIDETIGAVMRMLDVAEGAADEGR